jgi:hypothetical protein
MRWVAEERAGLRPFGLVFGAIGACTALLLRIAPHAVQRFSFCPLRAVTGVPCLSCGGTRAALALCRGDLAAALRANALVSVGLAACAAWAGWALLASGVPRLRGEPALGRREKASLRAATLAAIIAQWGWLIARRWA